MNMLTRFFRKISPQEKTIFIVEDNEVYAKSLHGFLSARFPDTKIRTFSTGEKCLLELYQNPDVIIMDHILNTGQSDAATGLSIIKKIKNASPAANIILLSAQKEFEVVAKTITKYDCAYLQKDDQVFNKVEQLIKKYMNNATSF